MMGAYAPRDVRGGGREAGPPGSRFKATAARSSAAATRCHVEFVDGSPLATDRARMGTRNRKPTAILLKDLAPRTDAAGGPGKVAFGQPGSLSNGPDKPAGVSKRPHRGHVNTGGAHAK
jgi:hypothetical protein